MIQTGVEGFLSNESNDSHDPGPQGEADSDGDGSDFSDDGPLSELILESIAADVDKLYRLSFKIRNPAIRLGFSKAMEFRQIDPETGTDLVAQFKQIDQNHIAELLGLYNESSSEKFTDHYLVSRLARANTYRRQQFGYWKMRRTKSELISQSAFLDKDDRVPAPAGHELQSQGGLEIPIAPITPSQPSTTTHLDVSKVNLDDEVSIISSSTVMHMGDADNGDSYSIPPPPKGLWDTGDFECPYCFTLCPRRMLIKKAWETHVLRDLRPYVCTYPNCKSGDQLYDTFSDWLNHEAFTHCLFFDTVENPSTEHCNATRSANGQPIIEQARDCPLCPMKAVDPIHVAAHLRRIACFALPRSVGSDDESNNGSQVSGMAERISHGSLSFLTGSVHLSDSNGDTSMELPAGPQLGEDAQNGNLISLESLRDPSFAQKDDEARVETYLKSVERTPFNDREHLSDDDSKEFSPAKTADNFLNHDYQGGSAQRWIRCLKNFASFIIEAPKIQPVKIAIIDDGIDLSVSDLFRDSIQGMSFFRDSYSDSRVGPWYMSTIGHGTWVATIIKELCPHVSLYVARLDGHAFSQDDGRKQITAESAAKALAWAVDCDVDIISIGWTIETASPDSPEIQVINTAMASAHRHNILVLSPASDQGMGSKGISSPAAADHCIRIGCASSSGHPFPGICESQFDFLIPGDQVFVKSTDSFSSTTISGSSLATAAASGLAGLLLCCSRLVDADEPNFFRGGQRMKKAFKALATVKTVFSDAPKDSRYLDVEYYFGTLFKDILREHIPQEEQPVKLIIQEVPWSSYSEEALRDLVKFIKYAT